MQNFIRIRNRVQLENTKHSVHLRHIPETFQIIQTFNFKTGEFLKVSEFKYCSDTDKILDKQKKTKCGCEKSIHF